jgi:hypothetical protein
MLSDDLERIEAALPGVYRLALGGTAVGTGINSAPPPPRPRSRRARAGTSAIGQADHAEGAAPRRERRRSDGRAAQERRRRRGGYQGSEERRSFPAAKRSF